MLSRHRALCALLIACAPGVAEARQLRNSLAVPEAAAASPHAAVGSTVRPVLLSAVLPGAGQYTLGSARWIAYAAVEAAALYWYGDRRAEGRDLEARYRDLAWEVARLNASGERRDGDFHYYEALADYERSGAYDADPVREGVQPETDPTTYNGWIWALARAIYFPFGVDSLPEDATAYRRAMGYYTSRAVGPEFAWSWEGRPEARTRYRQLIGQSDAAYRSASRALGLILANHVVSAVDAFVTARLRASRAAPLPIEFESDVRMRGREATWRATVYIALPER